MANVQLIVQPYRKFGKEETTASGRNGPETVPISQFFLYCYYVEMGETKGYMLQLHALYCAESFSTLSSLHLHPEVLTLEFAAQSLSL